MGDDVVGLAVGEDVVGFAVGENDGRRVGEKVGFEEGEKVGLSVEKPVGWLLDDSVVVSKLGELLLEEDRVGAKVPIVEGLFDASSDVGVVDESTTCVCGCGCNLCCCIASKTDESIIF